MLSATHAHTRTQCACSFGGFRSEQTGSEVLQLMQKARDRGGHCYGEMLGDNQPLANKLSTT